MTPEEIKFFDSCVHGLRTAGWSKIDAEDEALNRIEKQRQKARESADEPADL